MGIETNNEKGKMHSDTCKLNVFPKSLINTNFVCVLVCTIERGRVSRQTNKLPRISHWVLMASVVHIATAVAAAAAPAPQTEIRKYMAGVHFLVYRKCYWMACSVCQKHAIHRVFVLHVRQKSKWTMARQSNILRHIRFLLYIYIYFLAGAYAYTHPMHTYQIYMNGMDTILKWCTRAYIQYIGIKHMYGPSST